MFGKFFGLFWKKYFSVKTYCGYFWSKFWATFYSNISSHCESPSTQSGKQATVTWMNETISRSSSQRNHRSKMEDVRWLLAICFAFAVGICRADDDLFPLLMPKVNPTMAETYLCTPIRLNEDKTHYVIGFKPNATSHTAHHILVYGCEEPGSEADVYNCGEMSIQQPGENLTILLSHAMVNLIKHFTIVIYNCIVVLTTNLPMLRLWCCKLRL